MIQIEDKITNKLVEISKVNVFENTRRREVVEVRSILVKILRDYLGLKYKEIVTFFDKNGRGLDHSNLIYSYNMFDVYRRYNTDVDSWYNYIVDAMFDVDSEETLFTKKENLKNKIDILDEKHINHMKKYVKKVTKKEIEA